MFKIGDQVTPKKAGLGQTSAKLGDVYTVVKISISPALGIHSMDLTKNSDNSHYHSANGYNWELAPNVYAGLPPSSKYIAVNPHKFKIGDLVRHVASSNLWVIKENHEHTGSDPTYGLCSVTDPPGTNPVRDVAERSLALHMLHPPILSSDTVAARVQPKKCICEFQALLMFGCKCGGV